MTSCIYVCLYSTMYVMKRKSKADTKIRTALFLREEQLKKLQKLSENTGAPVAELVRRAIDAYLKLRAKEAQ